MNIGYVKKQSTPFKILDKIKYSLGIITNLQFEQGYVFKIPIIKKEKKIDKIVQRLLKQIQKLRIDTLVFSDELINDIFFSKAEEFLIKNNCQILNGRRLMNYMNYDIFEYILDLQRVDIKQEEVFFLIKKNDTLDLQFLGKFIENCKMVNIVTNDLERFKKIQESLYERENILISVSNNKSKALKRAKYIFNINMDKKDIDKFKMNRNAILIHFKENVKYSNNTFDGISANYFQINLPDEYVEEFDKISRNEEFDKVKLYESLLIQKIENQKRKKVILSKSDLKKQKNIVIDIIHQDEIKVSGLLGNNGRIDESEIIRNYQKNLTKNKN